MQLSRKQQAIVPLMARIMIPFRRAAGYGFDTEAFLNDETYAKIIVQEAMNSPDANLQALGKQLVQLLSQDDLPRADESSFAQTTRMTTLSRAPTTTQSPFLPTGTARQAATSTDAEALREELMRKYQGGIR